MNMQEPQAPMPAPPVEVRPSLWRRLANRVWGYDFFISYNWASGGTYAATLAKKLREEGFDCFLDQSEFAAGDNWRNEARQALRTTKRLIVIATPQAMKQSEAVQHEIEIFTSRSDRVIPIVFGQRFTEEEYQQYPSLRKISDTTIDVIEDADRLDEGPSHAILDELLQSHRVLSRRKLRTYIVAGALAVLTALLVVATVSLIFTAIARNQEQSAKLVNQADLFRETQGWRLEESLVSATEAYSLTRSDEARAAMEKARALMPERVGSGWTPDVNFPIQMRVVDQRLVLTPGISDESLSPGSPFAVIAEFDESSTQWNVLRSFTASEEDVLATDEYGIPIQAPKTSPWLFTQTQSQVKIWNIRRIENNAPYAVLDCDGNEEVALKAVNESATRALTRCGSRLVLWDLSMPPPQQSVAPQAPELVQYALSPSGRRLAWADQGELVVVDLETQQKLLNYSITQGGGHVSGLHFLGTSEASSDADMSFEAFLAKEDSGPLGNDLALVATWSENQVQASGVAARRNAPSNKTGIWYFEGLNHLSNQVPEVQRITERPPNIELVREEDFEVVYNHTSSEPSIAIVDPENPIQWLSLESQISYTLGAAAGPGEVVHFGREEMLIVHKDSTARLWDIAGRKELLRYTAGKVGIRGAVFLGRWVVTVDGEGEIQVWGESIEQKTF